MDLDGIRDGVGPQANLARDLNLGPLQGLAYVDTAVEVLIDDQDVRGFGQCSLPGTFFRIDPSLVQDEGLGGGRNAGRRVVAKTAQENAELGLVLGKP